MIESALLWYLLVLMCVYALIHALAWKGLRALSHPISDKLHSFSIIVAARNEEKNIRACLESLTTLNYPKELFEIIVVNDRSTDTTAGIIENNASKNSNIHLLNISANTTDMPDKKNALREAIRKSKNEILAFTDADCSVPPNWLRELSKQFIDNVGVVAGYSPNHFNDPKSFGSVFLRYEELKSSLGAAAGIGVRSAYMCTGRNFSYRQKVYNDVGGYEKIKHSISGDDDLFIQVIQRETNWEMRYITSPDSYVVTQPPQSVPQFIHQRTRHLSASKHYPLRMKVIFGVIHLFNFSFLVSFFFLPLPSLILLMAKINIDAIMTARGKELFNEEFSVIEFCSGELLYVLYNTFIGPLGFIKKFDWKGSQS